MDKNELFFPASSPENLGVPSLAVLSFIERIDREQTCMHGFLLLRKGQIAAEGYWAPYAENRFFITIKSVTAFFLMMVMKLGISTMKKLSHQEHRYAFCLSTQLLLHPDIKGNVGFCYRYYNYLFSLKFPTIRYHYPSVYFSFYFSNLLFLL